VSRPLVPLVLAIVALSVFMSAAPALIALADALVPLIVAVGAVAVICRLVWHFTDRY
jgi:hypothetical protein